jgi:hypothetical protein
MQFQGKPALARYRGVVTKCGKQAVIGGRFFRESALVLLNHVIVIRGLPDREGKKIAVMKRLTVSDVITGTGSCVLFYSVQARQSFTGVQLLSLLVCITILNTAATLGGGLRCGNCKTGNVLIT